MGPKFSSNLGFSLDSADLLWGICIRSCAPTVAALLLHMIYDEGIEISNPISWHEQTLSSRDFTLGKYYSTLTDSRSTPGGLIACHAMLACGLDELCTFLYILLLISPPSCR